MKIVFVFICLSLTIATASASLSARQIMEKHEDARKFTDQSASAQLTTKTSDGGSKQKEFRWWRKLQGNKTHFSTLTRFQKPAEVKNEAILFLENTGAKNDIFLYLPSFKKIRRVESQQQSGSFMNSDLSYSDMATPHVDDYNYKLLKNEKCPTSEAKNVDCFVVEALPINDDVRARTGYSKSKMWVRTDNFMIVRAEYDDTLGKPYKKLTAEKIEKVDVKNGKWMALSIFMENLQAKSSTAILFSQVKCNSGIQDSIFTQQNLMKEK